MPLIYGIGIRGQGRWAKHAAALITSASGLGPTVFPFTLPAVQKSHTIKYSYCVYFALFAAATVFPLYLILFPCPEPLQRSLEAIYNAT